MPTGSAVLDFGTGSDMASVDVTGQGAILAGSKVEAQIRLSPTTGGSAEANHNADEHRLEALKVSAGNIVAGTGFTIYGLADGPFRLQGTFNCDWVWV